MKLINNLILTFAIILMVSCKAQPQSESATFRYEAVVAVHENGTTLEADQLIACDSSLIRVTITKAEVRLEIDNMTKIFENHGNLSDDASVLKLVDPMGGKALLYRKSVDGFQVWYIQGPVILIRLSNSKPECAK